MIVSTPDTCGGEPRIDGTRITVANILGTVGRALDFAIVRREYPRLTTAQVSAAIRHAQWHMALCRDPDPGPRSAKPPRVTATNARIGAIHPRPHPTELETEARIALASLAIHVADVAAWAETQPEHQSTPQSHPIRRLLRAYTRIASRFAGATSDEQIAIDRILSSANAEDRARAAAAITLGRGSTPLHRKVPGCSCMSCAMSRLEET